MKYPSVFALFLVVIAPFANAQGVVEERNIDAGRPGTLGSRVGEKEKKGQGKSGKEKAGERIKEIAGTAEFLRQLPKKFARLVSVEKGTGRITLQAEGEAKESVWQLMADGEVKVHGFWGRPEDLHPGDRVWAWFHIDRKGRPIALAMLADEISQQDINGTPHEVLAIAGNTVMVKTKKEPARELSFDAKALPEKGARLYIQSAGKHARLAWTEKELESRRSIQKTRQEKRWKGKGLPGAAGFIHIFSGEMDVLLDHEGMRWGRSLDSGDRVSLHPVPTKAGDDVSPIAGVVKSVSLFRDRTQVRLVVKNRELSAVAPGQRVFLQVPPPDPKIAADLPPDIDRAHGGRQERIEWFLSTIYCTCGVKGDRCTGHFYTLSSCNPNACGMPNQMRRTLGKLIDAGLTDRQILDELLRQKGPALLRPHLLP